MAIRLAVAVIHGMGTQAQGFSLATQRALERRLRDLGRDSDAVAFQEIYWAPVVQGREDEYWQAAKQEADLDYVKLRRFVLSAFGDAVAYQKVASPDDTTYDEIHGCVATALRQLYFDTLGGHAVPLVVLAHSLGGHIVSNFTWDRQHEPITGVLSPFERMEHLAGLVTFGCNIPLFSFAYERPQPIRFPGDALDEATRAKARWLNFYDPDDVLAYPLRAIPEYRAVVERDVAINVGGVLSSWNPMAHSAYWTDADFVRPVAEFLASFLG